ncbi:MAG: DUF2779 domain-containing protein [Gemmatimonadota bacterium]
MRHTLSKSDFKLARSCVTKLYYKELGFPQNTADNPYLAMLAEGGYMVEQLAKLMFPDGVAAPYDRRDPVGSAAGTRDLLLQDPVTLFEATLLADRLLARVDILRRAGNRFDLIEVKSVSFDSDESRENPAGPFRGKRAPHGITTKFQEYLEDVAFQVFVLRRLYPGAEIVPHLMLVDQARRTGIEGLPAMFRVERSADGGELRVEFLGDVAAVRADQLLAQVNVADEVAMLLDEVGTAADHFATLLGEDGPVKEQRAIDWGCRDCEFRVDAGEPLNGFAQCWGRLAEPSPHLFELYKFGATKYDGARLADVMIQNGMTSLYDVDGTHLVKKDGSPTASSRRQLIQIEHTRLNRPWIGDGLRPALEALRLPLHFIDFETSLLALPYHKGMRGYEKVAFQWSCHTVVQAGDAPVHREWLNTRESWPNAEFVHSLREAIGESDPVLTWSPYEGSVLREIRSQLARYNAADPELEQWLDRVVDERIVDLCRLCEQQFFHPGMRGRVSIKVVLDALWKADPVMRERYAEWMGVADADAATGPYEALPPVVIGTRELNVADGTGAMQAYTAMLYGAERLDPEIRKSWESLLLRYCKLDTLAMVLIWDHWRRVTA